MNPVTHLRRSNFMVSVHVDGKPVPFYMRADGTPFVEGVPGKTYAVHIENLFHERIEVIASVDGRNTLKEEPADWDKNIGMVIRPGQTWKNKGWRLNDNEVAEFKFADPEASVAAAAGAPKNIGVLGVAIYHEKTYRPVYRGGQHVNSGGGGYLKGAGGQSLGGGNYDKSYGGGERGVEISANSRGMDYCSDIQPISETKTSGGIMRSMDADIGTGAGETRRDTIGRTEWTRNTAQPVELLSIQYRTRETLQRMGLLSDGDPQAFINRADDTGYGKLLNR